MEAELAARVQHPNIVQVYETGIAADGRPFFAMEFIRGLPLDEYANRNGLDLRARVALWRGCATPYSTPMTRVSSTAT